MGPSSLVHSELRLLRSRHAARNIEETLERIGFKAKKAVVGLPQEQPRTQYPHVPPYKMKFEEMLRRARYDDETIEQYKPALDIEVRSTCTMARLSFTADAAASAACQAT